MSSDGVETSREFIKSDDNTPHYHVHSSNSSTDLLAKPPEAIKRHACRSGNEGLCASSLEGQRECARQVVQLQSVCNALAERGRRVRADGVVDGLDNLEQECIEELYECNLTQATVAECTSLSKCYYALMQMPEVKYDTLSEAHEAWRDNAEVFTGNCGRISPHADETLPLQHEMKTEKADDSAVCLFERDGEEAALQ
eukprot:4658650-Amphidinium_carterae.1